MRTRLRSRFTAGIFTQSNIHITGKGDAKSHELRRQGREFSLALLREYHAWQRLARVPEHVRVLFFLEDSRRLTSPDAITQSKSQSILNLLDDLRPGGEPVTAKEAGRV